LRELGVVRVPRPDGGFRYTVPEVGVTRRDHHILERELRDYLVQIERAQNLTVVKTLPGHAQSVCAALDRMEWTEIIGTIGGEDTILIVSRTTRDGENVARKIAAVSGENG
jgi:transcriptional regulator of arginine metabolism